MSKLNHGYPNYGYEFPLKKPSEGYFYAKREVADAIIRRVDAFAGEVEGTKDNPRTEIDRQIAKAKIEALEELRSFIRNVMLWDTDRGK
jgi:hypothetical protein